MTTSSIKDGYKTIQLRFPEDKKNEIKSFAAQNGLTIHQLVLNMFEAYKKQNKEEKK